MKIDLTSTAGFPLELDTEAQDIVTEIEANEHYTSCPPLVRLVDLTGSPFAPPREDVPWWSSFVNEPEVYTMLSNPAGAQRHFKPQSLNKTD